jgi:Zn-dependent protease
VRDTIRLGRIAGIPIGANWSIVAVAAYLVVSLAFAALPRWWPSADLTARLVTGGSITLLFFLSILGHELGHAAAARRHGVEVDGITLWVLGGIAKLRRQAPTPRAEFEIAAAGPAASLLLGAAFAGAALGIDRWSTWGLAASACSWLAITNGFLGVSNLLPIAPLDGGRVLTAWLWRSSNEAEHARLTSARAGLVVGAVVVLASTAVFALSDRIGWWVFALTALTGLFIAHAAWREIVGAVVRRRLADTWLKNVMVARPPSIPDDVSIDAFHRSAIVDRPGVARPVVRWSNEPLGYVSPASTETVDPVARSWTSIGQIMTPVETVRRAWTTESVADLIAREGDAVLAPGAIVVVHDPGDGQPVGTLTPLQLEPLFTSPNPWGISATSPPPPTVPVPV